MIWTLDWPCLLSVDSGCEKGRIVLVYAKSCDLVSNFDSFFFFLYLEPKFGSGCKSNGDVTTVLLFWTKKKKIKSKKYCLHHFRSIYFNKFTWFRPFAAVQIYRINFKMKNSIELLSHRAVEPSRSTHQNRIRIDAKILCRTVDANADGDRKNIFFFRNSKRCASVLVMQEALNNNLTVFTCEVWLWVRWCQKCAHEFMN